MLSPHATSVAVVHPTDYAAKKGFTLAPTPHATLLPTQLLILRFSHLFRLRQYR